MAQTHYDVIIIGAGMSGLAAGIRLAYFDKSVCVLERHYAAGGLNSFYALDGHQFDVGLHAMTNYVQPGTRGAPLTKIFRQLRLTPEDFGLAPQHHSEVQRIEALVLWRPIPKHVSVGEAERNMAATRREAGVDLRGDRQFHVALRVLESTET